MNCEEDYKKGQLVFSMEKNIEKLILEAYEDNKTKVEHVTTYQSIFEKKIWFENQLKFIFFNSSST